MENRTEHLKIWLRTWIECGALPGAMLGIYDENGNELFFHSESCRALAESGKAYEKDTLFRIYSMTKPITTVAVMMLVERGVLTVEDELQRWIPAFAGIQVAVGGTLEEPQLEAPREALKLKHLLTHTSGLSYGFFGNNLSDQAIRQLSGDHYKTWYSDLTLEELCEIVAKAPLCFHPGSKFHYGLSTDVLARVVEVASGLRIDDFFQKEIFTPLGMNDTCFAVSPENAHRLVDCYELTPSKQFRLSTNRERDRLQPRPLLSGGGGLVSSIGDYSKFTSLLLSGGTFKGVRLLSEASVELMTRNQLPNGAEIADFSFENGFSEQVGPGAGFGYGFAVATNPTSLKGGSLSYKGEFGWGGVAATCFMVDPVRKLSSIFMTQLIPAASEYPIRIQQRWLVCWAFDNHKETARAKRPLPQEQQDNLAKNGARSAPEAVAADDTV